MIIKLSESELKKCQKLLDVKESNISAAEIYIDYLNNHYNDIKKSDIELLSKKYPLNQSFYKAFLKKLSISENDPEYVLINKDCQIEKMEKLSQEEYLNDAFYKTIKDINIKENDWQFLTLKYLPYEGFVYDELIIDKTYYAEHTPIGFFDKEFPYLALLQGERIWMSVIPHEINTMKKAINKAHGHVLVLGLGLGYYLFNIVSKKDVISIDVVEKDKTIIDLFNKYLLNKFPYYEKINIIHDDGVEYLKKRRQYDYCFVDIYHNVGDGEMLYLKVKDKEIIQKDTTFSYWIEESILAMIRRQTLTVFEECLDGYSDEDYKKAQNENDKIINAIYFLTKDYVVDSFTSLHKLLSDDSLKGIAQNIIKEMN